MSTILIDLTALSDEEQKKTCLPIKLFHHDRKELNQVIIGKTDNILTIKDIKGISIIECKDASNTESTLDVISQALKKNDIDGFVTFRNKTQISRFMEKNFKRSDSTPFICTFYPNAYTGKKTLLGDLGYKQNRTEGDYLTALSEMKEIVRKLTGNESPTSKLLLPSGLPKSEFALGLIEKLKEDPNYNGELGSADMLQAKTDILLGDPIVIQSTISGINQGVTVYNEYLEKGMNTSFQYKMGGFFIQKLMDTFNASIDKKITSGGMLLYGFEKKVVLIGNDTTQNNIRSALDFAYECITELNQEQVQDNR